MGEVNAGVLFCIFFLYHAQIAMSPSETVSQRSLLPEPAKACGFFFRRPATAGAVLRVHQVQTYSRPRTLLLNSTSQPEQQLPPSPTSQLQQQERLLQSTGYPLKEKA